MSPTTSNGDQRSRGVARSYLFISLLLAASVGWADEPRSTIGFRGHVGKTDARMLSRKTLWHFGATYLFNMTPSLSLGFGYVGGSTNKGLLGPDSSLVYRACGVVSEGRLPLSQRNNIFARLSGLIYDHEHENFTGKVGATGAVTQQDGVELIIVAVISGFLIVQPRRRQRSGAKRAHWNSLRQHAQDTVGG